MLVLIALLTACHTDAPPLAEDGTDAAAYTYGEIESVRNSGKVVLAYMSLGEASNFRFYWDGWSEGSPSFIGPENPNYPGSHKAKYWKRAWWSWRASSGPDHARL